MTTASHPMRSKKDKLVDLLNQRRECKPDTASAREHEHEIVTLIEQQLRDDLRHILFGANGADVDEAHASRRFTELLQQFFVKVLDDYPEGLLKVETRTHLVGYIARSLQNMLTTHYRSNTCHDGKQDVIARLAELRESRLQHDLPARQLSDVLDQLDAWDNSGDKTQQQWAAAIRYYYLVGMPNEQVGRQLKLEKPTFEKLSGRLGVSRSAAHRLCEQALSELKRVLDK